MAEITLPEEVVDEDEERLLLLLLLFVPGEVNAALGPDDGGIGGGCARVVGVLAEPGAGILGGGVTGVPTCKQDRSIN